MIDLIHTLVLTRLVHRRQFLSPDALLRLQRLKLERLVAFARARSPFFARLYRDVPATGFALADLPVVAKTRMLEHFDEYVTDRRLTLRDLRAFVADPLHIGKTYLGYVAFHTSGTAGEPSVLVYDRNGFRHVHAVHLARGMRHEGGLGRSLKRLREPLRIAAVIMDGGLFPGYSGFLHMPRFTRGVIDVRTFSLREPVGALLEHLREFRPMILAGYPSILAEIASESLTNGSPVLAGGPEDLAVCLGEPLSAATIELIGRGFASPVADLYGAGECLAIAQSCEHAGRGELHVNDDEAILEVVDASGRPVAPGVEGSRIYVTNLSNFVQPFIRFELTDVTARLAGRCACGRGLSRIGAVTGRTDEPVRVGRPGGGTAVLQPYWLMVPLIGFSEIREWQVTQIAPNELAVSFVRAGAAPVDPARVEEALRRSLIQARVDAPIRWLVREVEHIAPDPATGKVRRIWNRMEREEKEK